VSEASRLLSDHPLRAVLRLALPTSAVMVLGATSGVLHTYFVCRLGSHSIAAVSLVFPIHLTLMTMMGGGVGAGVSAAIAQALGAGRTEAANAAASHALWITSGLALVLTTILLAGSRSLFRWMGGEGEVLEGATVFSRVLFGGSVVTFAVSTLDSILRGEGNVRIPSVWATVSLLAQIVFTPIFMFWLGFGLAGAAAATIAGQLVGSLPRVWFLFGGRATVQPRLFPFRPSTRTIADILRIGVPASLSTLTNYLGLVLLTGVVARYGTHDIAAFGLGTRLDFLVVTLAFGVGSAVLTLVGLASGAGDDSRVREVVTRGLELVLALLTVVSLVLVWKPQLWLGIFTADPEITVVGSRYLRAVGPSYPFVGASMILGFAFQGIGRAVYPLLLTAGRTALVVGGAVTLASRDAPVASVFLLMAVGNVATTLLLFARLRRILGRR
jgi:putative MATE family efflux protein